MKSPKVHLAALVGLWALSLSCTDSKLDSQADLAAEASQDSNVEDSKSQLASEPVSVGGAFLHVRCGSYTDDLYGCGIHENGSKYQDSTIESVKIEGQDLAINQLTSSDPWHVSFSLPEDLQPGIAPDAIEAIVQFTIADQSYERRSPEGLSGEPLVVANPEAQGPFGLVDIAAPETFRYPVDEDGTVTFKNNFDQSPIVEDSDGDGTADWRLRDPGELVANAVEKGIFINREQVQLKSQPEANTPHDLMSVEYAAAHVSNAGMGAEFWISVNYGANVSAVVFVHLQNVGTSQTAILYTKEDGNPRVELARFENLALGFQRVSLFVDTGNRLVSMAIGQNEVTSLAFPTFTANEVNQFTIAGRDSDVAFAYVHSVVDPSAGGVAGAGFGVGFGND
ncbi:hypothetical protein [Pseudobacteriovorax antillogorgiicola]|uniref:Uncharacterized protein n=1 Tax=Pseudobacteriovorax antillogorgiicola TaxID=1513793 RepID=A0A1Y6CB84_9BACT|nr:hypothetical protein [Pseudobacteriovorax antillogorgiicola]TCS49009.1 hypothetical protein EDD56_11651 [Pseudobacteriovorax antillogorgiicola]SMF53153.1 hypothetical protein SAMN06296036_116103 [Pseudobacteriovorax antillogorgiicola]